MGAHTWSCPGCGRRVPLRVTVCHCGMTRARAEEVASAREAATTAARDRARPRPRRAREVTWSTLPRDVKGLLVGFTLVVVAAIGWLAFGPRPRPVAPVLGYVDASPPPVAKPTPPPVPAFKLPWWK